MIALRAVIRGHLQVFTKLMMKSVSTDANAAHITHVDRSRYFGVIVVISSCDIDESRL